MHETGLFPSGRRRSVRALALSVSIALLAALPVSFGARAVLQPAAAEGSGSAAQGRTEYTFLLTGDGSVRITGCKGHDACLVIPDTLDGHPVSAIDMEAFAGDTVLESVTVPEGVAWIGYRAFADCTSLTEVTLPDSIEGIDYYAFRGCGSLARLTAPEAIPHVGGEAFAGCPALADDRGFIIVGGQLNSYAGPGGDVVIPDGVTSVGYCAFYSADTVTGVTIPDSVTLIDDGAFFQCTRLTRINIPDGAVLRGNPFESCWALREIGVSPDHPALLFENGALIERDGMKLLSCCCGLSAGRCEVPRGVKVIGEQAFRQCGADTVILPDTVTAIESRAFLMSGLREITIPAGVTAIRDNVFDSCSRLRAIHVDPGNPVYAGIDGMLVDKSTMTVLSYPPALDTEVLVIPEGIRAISSYAFTECGLRSVVIPDTVSSIGYGAFRGCTRLTGVTFPAGITEIPGQAFLYCSDLRSVTVPDSVTRIGDSAFEGCAALGDAVIPAGVTYIAGHAFSGWDFKGSYIPIDGLNMIVHSGSYAEQYCIGNDLPYTVVD